MCVDRIGGNKKLKARFLLRSSEQRFMDVPPRGHSGIRQDLNAEYIHINVLIIEYARNVADNEDEEMQILVDATQLCTC
jgi:hypothetical protein